MEQSEQIISQQYQQFLVEITDMVMNHRIQAVQSVQTISNNLYWNIGELIIKKQQEFGWGKSIVEILSNDLSKLIGEGISWSPRNLWFMRQLVNEYSNLNQADSESLNLNQPDSDLTNIKQLVTSIPWQHNILIIQKVKNHLEVEYALKSVNKPIGVSEYILSKQLPKELEGKLPTSEQFKNILNE